MSSSYATLRGDRDVLRIPVIRVAFALSLLIHAAALWPWLPPLHLLSPEDVERKEAASRFQVRLAPIAIPVPPPSPAPQSQRATPPRRLRAPAPAPRQPTPPPAPLIALAAPGAAIPPQPPPAPIASVPKPAPIIGDMAAMIEARRRARGDPAPPVPRVAEDENARRDRIVAENLGTLRAPTFGDDPRSSGGIFQIQHLFYDNADFMFYGWNRDIRRNTRQLIEVRKGNNSDIRVAVVRRMIAIIREHEQEDFRWDSQRLGRSLTLSARQRDSAGLEEFLMREFFEDFVRTR